MAIFLLAGLLVPYLLDVDRYRASISSLISEQTGRQVTLGMIRARILPQVGFDVAGFHMSNPQGFVAGEFIDADQLRGTLAFWPLVLHRQLRLTSLELVRPKLALLQNSRGETNYTFSVSPSARIVHPSNAQPRYVQADFAAALPQRDIHALDAPLSVSSVLQVDELILRDATVIYGNVDESGRITSIVQSAGFIATLRTMRLQPLVVRAWQADANLNGARVTLAEWHGPIAFRSGSVTLRNGDLKRNFLSISAKPPAWTALCPCPTSSTPSSNSISRASTLMRTNSSPLPAPPIKRYKRRMKLLHNLVATQSAATPTSPLSGNIAATAAPAQRTGPSTAGARAGGASHSSAATSNATPNRNDEAANPSNKLLAQGHLDAKKVRWGAYVAGPATADLKPAATASKSGLSLRVGRRFAASLGANRQPSDAAAFRGESRGSQLEPRAVVDSDAPTAWQTCRHRRTRSASFRFVGSLGVGTFAHWQGGVCRAQRPHQRLQSLWRRGIHRQSCRRQRKHHIYRDHRRPDIGQERIASSDIHLDSPSARWT